MYKNLGGETIMFWSSKSVSTEKLDICYKVTKSCNKLNVCKELLITFYLDKTVTIL